VALLTLQQKPTKTFAFSTSSLFGPIKPPHIPVTLAIYGLPAPFFASRPLFHKISENVLAACIGSTIFNERSHFFDVKRLR